MNLTSACKCYSCALPTLSHLLDFKLGVEAQAWRLSLKLIVKNPPRADNVPQKDVVNLKSLILQ